MIQKEEFRVRSIIVEKDEKVLRGNTSASLLLLILIVVILADETGLDFVEDNLVSVSEGLLESLVESSLAGSSLGLLGTTLLGSLLLNSSSASSLASGNSLLFGGASGLGVRVESLHSGLVLKRVLLALGGDVGVDTLHAELGLDLIGVDDSSEVSARHHVSSELESTLLDTSLSVGTEDVIELLEGILGEDDKSSKMTTRGELEEIQSGDVASVDAGKISGGRLDLAVLVTVDDQRSLAEGETRVSHLALASAGSLGGADTGEVTSTTNVVEALEESSSLLLVEAVDDERKLGHIIDLMTTGHDEGTASGGGESGGNSVSLLVGVNLSLPLSPDLEGSEHATLTAHVTEGTLAGTVSTGARDSWDSSDGATSTPGFGGVLVTGVPEDGMSLSSVLGHVGVAELDEIISDGSSEDGRHVGGASNLLSVGGVHADGRTGSHLLKVR